MKEAKEEKSGTISLGKVDKMYDGEETRRDRRKLIVIKQKRGTSLSLSL
jgi:hypothetical protein